MVSHYIYTFRKSLRSMSFDAPLLVVLKQPRRPYLADSRRLNLSTAIVGVFLLHAAVLYAWASLLNSAWRLGFSSV